MISIIIPAYNAAEFILEAVSSIMRQDCTDYEIIIVDDGSTDSTRDVLNKLIDSKEIKYIHQVNSGPGAARNRGLEVATKDYVCFLDADDALLPYSISKRVDFMDRHPEVSMVFTDLYRCRTKDDTSEIHLRADNFLEKFAEAVISSTPPEYVFDARYVSLAFKHNPSIKTPTVMVRRETFDKVGLFDCSLRAAEDVDMWLRIARRMPIGFIDEPLTYWNNFRSSLTSDAERFFNDTLVFYKKEYQAEAINPLERQYLKQKIARLLFNFGYHLLEQHRRSEARSLFVESLGHRLMYASAWKCLGLTLLPQSTLSMLKQLKEMFSKHA